MEPTKNLTELARELWREMAEMRNSLRQYVHVKIKENNWDISMELVEILGLVYRRKGLNQQEIADIIVKDKSSMTYLIDNLVRKGLVERTEDQRDRRNKLISITEKGRLLMEELNPWVTEIYEKATRELMTDDVLKALSVARKMNDNLKQL
ncbi:MarR family winged helix-turn-helix transcriptional regulator [Chitinophaga sp. sic0106]|uniref:MarR family winged helix-turn-helix transcriptional regulator n=1 Tax=Chitinophaga sp. sic0106 TaxID=2854785 RepID=UPI001C454F69|nr:MarR family transcriptional regulator [Chitinophaga sp. sic0106]MBV7533156.1 MarR family transcriptional regulator [Chitinophaga sp. sic0106]